MTLYLFNQLSDEMQLAYVYREGTYLAQRWDDFDLAVNLYQVPAGF